MVFAETRIASQTLWAGLSIASTCIKHALSYATPFPSKLKGDWACQHFSIIHKNLAIVTRPSSRPRIRRRSGTRDGFGMKSCDSIRERLDGWFREGSEELIVEQILFLHRTLYSES